MIQQFFTHVLENPTFPTPTLLDVTLRDGSFPMAFRWKEEGIACVVHALTQAAVPAIELGYYGGVPDDHFQGDTGLTGDLPLSLVRDLTAPYPSTLFAVMIHPAAIHHPPDFQALHAAGIQLVRLVYQENQLERLRSWVQTAHEAGLQTSLNLTTSSRYTRLHLLQILFRVLSCSPSMIYLADTNAAFYPNQVATLFDVLSSVTSITPGFHAHDFLSLAFANAFTAANHGAQYIDSSILGLGRGAGNLRTELWCIAALSQNKGTFCVEALLPAMEYIQRQERHQAHDLMAVIAGAYNFTPPEEQHFREIAASRDNGDASAMACAYLSRHQTFY
jgi:isopropylmalate/homocitrate/citramalate synthase